MSDEAVDEAVDAVPHRAPAEVAAVILRLGPAVALLDFDGTLSPIVAVPDDAMPAPGAVAALRALARRMPVVIVSGRSVADLRRRLPDDLDATLVGGHGAERAHGAGAVEALVEVAVLRPTLDRLEARLAWLVDPDAGWQVERKPTGVAVHWRRVTGDVGEGIAAVRAAMAAASGTPPGFEVIQGKAVIELRAAGVSKGEIVREVAAAHPQRLTFVIGDDITDEDAFRACNELGGCTVVVADPPKRSAAQLALRDPAEVVATLERLTATG